MARKRQVVVERPAILSFDDEVRERIRSAGYVASRIYRVYQPQDTYGISEILFRGHETGRYDPDDKYRPLTAWLPTTAEGTVIVSEGW